MRVKCTMINRGTKMAANKNYYWCDNGHDMVQIQTNTCNPRCPICGAVMTYGRYF